MKYTAVMSLRRDQIRKNIEQDILLGLAESLQTLYGLNKEKKLALSTLHDFLARLQETGQIRSVKTEKWRTGGLRREYKLTIKGFIRLLSEAHSSDVEAAVKKSGSTITYRVVEHEITETKRSTRKTKYKINFKTIFPLNHHEVLRKDIGEEPYFRSLISAAKFVYREIESHEVAERIRFRTEEGKKDLAWIHKHRKSLVEQGIPIENEEKLAKNFGFEFLNRIFDMLDPNLAYTVLLHTEHTNQELYDEVKMLLAEKVDEIKKRENHLELIQSYALRHFDPNV